MSFTPINNILKEMYEVYDDFNSKKKPFKNNDEIIQHYENYRRKMTIVFEKMRTAIQDQEYLSDQDIKNIYFQCMDLLLAMSMEIFKLKAELQIYKNYQETIEEHFYNYLLHGQKKGGDMKQ